MGIQREYKRYSMCHFQWRNFRNVRWTSNEVCEMVLRRIWTLEHRTIKIIDSIFEHRKLEFKISMDFVQGTSDRNQVQDFNIFVQWDVIKFTLNGEKIDVENVEPRLTFWCFANLNAFCQLTKWNK